MTNLIDILTAETASLKVQYIAKTLEWAHVDFARIERAAAKPHPVYQEYVAPAKPRPASFVGFWSGQDYEGQKRYCKAVEAREAAYRIVQAGLAAYLVKVEKAAIDHYTGSIAKLAARIQKKGLNVDALTVKTAHVGVNIETVLTDGTQIVKAFTIIAAGDIIKPHYRYLIK